MKYVKMLGLLAVAAAALMAFAATASATTITSPTGTSYTGKIHATNEGHVTLKNPIANISCASTVEGSLTSHGSGVTASGPITTLDFTGCTNFWHVTTIEPGTLTLHALGGGKGTLTSDGALVDSTRLGVTCVYETADTHIGTVTDSHVTKETATLHIDAVIPIEPETSSSLCGDDPAAWEGSYKVNTPNSLYID